MANTNIFTFFFKGADIKILSDANPDYVLVSAEIQIGDIGGTSVAYIVVKANAFKTGTSTPVANIGGCPVPPCVPGATLALESCINQANSLIDSYVQNDLF